MENRTLTFSTKIETRAKNETEEPHISGYFAVFDEDYQLWDDFFERISPYAFNKALNEKADVRALTDHKTDSVLGRTKAGTLSLKVDDHGLFGDIAINPKDSEAMNLYARVERGDVSQCSFGFMIDRESITYRDDGSILRTIEDLTLFEVSICTFPAYESTEVTARSCLEARKDSLQAELEKINSHLERSEENEAEAPESIEANQEVATEAPNTWREDLLSRIKK